MHPFRTYCCYFHPNRLSARFCARCGLGVTPGWKWLVEDVSFFFFRAFSSPTVLVALAGMAMVVFIAAIVFLAVL